MRDRERERKTNTIKFLLYVQDHLPSKTQEAMSPLFIPNKYRDMIETKNNHDFIFHVKSQKLDSLSRFLKLLIETHNV